MADQSAINQVVRACFRKPADVAQLARLDAALRPSLVAMLVSMRPPDRAAVEDAYQNAFVKFIKLFRSSKFKAHMNYEAYFLAVAKNCLIDELRKQSRTVPLDEMVEQELPAENGILPAEARLIVLQAIEGLEPRCRYVIEQYYLAERPSSELAAELGVQPGSIHMLIKRCRDRLAELLQPVRKSRAATSTDGRT